MSTKFINEYFFMKKNTNIRAKTITSLSNCVHC